MPDCPPIHGLILPTNTIKNFLEKIRAVPALPKDASERLLGLELHLSPFMPPDLGACVDKDGNVLYIFKLGMEQVEGT